MAIQDTDLFLINNSSDQSFKITALKLKQGLGPNTYNNYRLLVNKSDYTSRYVLYQNLQASVAASDYMLIERSGVSRKATGQQVIDYFPSVPAGSSGEITSTTVTSLTLASDTNLSNLTTGDAIRMVDEDGELATYTPLTSAITNKSNASSTTWFNANSFSTVGSRQFENAQNFIDNEPINAGRVRDSQHIKCTFVNAYPVPPGYDVRMMSGGNPCTLTAVLQNAGTQTLTTSSSSGYGAFQAGYGEKTTWTVYTNNTTSTDYITSVQVQRSGSTLYYATAVCPSDTPPFTNYSSLMKEYMIKTSSAVGSTLTFSNSQDLALFPAAGTVEHVNPTSTGFSKHNSSNSFSASGALVSADSFVATGNTGTNIGAVSYHIPVGFGLKLYWELQDGNPNNSPMDWMGIVTNKYQHDQDYPGRRTTDGVSGMGSINYPDTGWSISGTSGSRLFFGGGTFTINSSSVPTNMKNTTVGFAVDVDAGKFWVSVNGSWTTGWGVGDPSSGGTPTVTADNSMSTYGYIAVNATGYGQQSRTLRSSAQYTVPTGFTFYNGQRFDRISNRGVSGSTMNITEGSTFSNGNTISGPALSGTGNYVSHSGSVVTISNSNDEFISDSNRLSEKFFIKNASTVDGLAVLRARAVDEAIAWSSSASYIEHDIISHSGYYWIALEASQNVTPTTDNYEKWLGLGLI